MKNVVSAPWSQKQDLKELLGILRPALIVGGAVRNALLGVDISDIDIATEMLPEEVMTVAKRAGFNVIPTGLSHGTVTCVKDDAYEVTTLRVDKFTYGRHAEVEFSNSWEEDAKRRDFTMNALYSDFDGNIKDYVNGMKDLEDRNIKFIGNPEERINEDYLRILRFFRFYAHYGTKYDEASLNACGKLCANLKSISRERCTYEFLKMLKSAGPWESVKLMSDDIFAYSGLPLPNWDDINRLLKEEGSIDIKSSYIGKAAGFIGKHELVLSRMQSKYIAKLHNLTPLKTLPAYVEWINESPAEILWDGILLKGKENKLYVNKLNTWINNKFPLQGADIMSLGVPQGPAINEHLQRAKKFFYHMDHPCRKSELLSVLKNKILDS
jgi:poly(A) polymerase